MAGALLALSDLALVPILECMIPILQMWNLRLKKM